MIGFIAMRLVQSVIVMLTVALIAFALFRFVGDPDQQSWSVRIRRWKNAPSCANALA